MKLFLAVGQLLLYAQLTIGYSFTITDFTNNNQISKNVNGLNQEQTDKWTMEKYEFDPKTQCANFKSKCNSYWYSHFLPWNCNPKWQTCACIDFDNFKGGNKINYLRFYVKGGANGGSPTLSLNVFLRSSKNSDCSWNDNCNNYVEEYIKVESWKEADNGYWVGELDLNKMKCNRKRMIKFGFLLSPHWVDYKICKITFESDCYAKCPNDCSGHGISCGCDGKCNCQTEWTGKDCSERTCLNDCHGTNGVCDKSTGKCKCNYPWSGDDCGKRCPDCNNNGDCIDGECQCRGDFIGPNCKCKSCSPSDCNGKERGKCECGKCVCNEPYYGNSCEFKRCPDNCNFPNGNCDSKTGICVCQPNFVEPSCKCQKCPGNGDCFKNGDCDCGTCRCKPNYKGPDCKCKSCPEDCNKNGDCICGTCKCYDDFRLDTNCKCKTCPGNGNCNGIDHGNCGCNGECTCKPGFSGNDCSCIEKVCLNGGVNDCKGKCTCDTSKFTGEFCQCKRCPNDCSGNGLKCNCDGTCDCKPGYSGADCSCFNCPGTCKDGVCKCGPDVWREGCECLPCPKGCSGKNGNCGCNGKCTCEPGFSGDDCSCIEKACLNGGVNDCKGKCTCDTSKYTGDFCQCKRCPNDCSGNGKKCNCDGTCDCKPEYFDLDCSKKYCPGNCTNEKAGTCDYQTGKCTCFTGYGKEDCSCEQCHKNCNGPTKGICDCKGKCQCNYPFSGPDCSCIDKNCNGNGKSDCQGNCICDPGYWGSDCSCLNKTVCRNNGKLNCHTGFCDCPPEYAARDCSCFLKYCNGHGEPNCKGGCVCDYGYDGSDCSCVKTECQNGGTPTCDGKCSCKPGFSGKFCECIVNSCNGHGTANCLGKCTCDEKYEGANCESLKCQNNCNERGKCNNGTCVCYTGFSGPACECLTCASNCSGHGDCKCDGTCDCKPDFKGSADCKCKTRVCGECKNGNGTYNCETGFCNCLAGWSGALCDCNTNCQPKCQNNGSCACSGKCVCPAEWKGSADCKCKTRICGECKNGNGTYNCETGFCNCLAGWTGALCDCPVSCPAECKNKGVCKCGKCECPADWQGASSDCSCKTPIGPCGKGGTGLYNCTTGDCICQAGWTGKTCDCNQNCPKGCSNHGVCNCNATCACKDDWSGSSDCSCRTPIGLCFNGVDHPYRYSCETGLCNCSQGWSGPLCDCKTTCPNNCSNHGECYCGECRCQVGWTGSSDCSCKTPIGVCLNGNGSYHCDTGHCVCKPGWTGPNCECPSTCLNNCSGIGNCTCGACICPEDYTMSPDCSCRNPIDPANTCEKGQYDCKTGKCLPDCLNSTCPLSCLISEGSKGCNCSNLCDCLPGFYGKDCECRVPNSPCLNNGSALCDGTCNCTEQYSGPYCGVINCPPDCLNSVGCDSSGNCICKTGYRGTKCDQKNCTTECFNGGTCGIDGTCQCLENYILPDCKCQVCPDACTVNAGSLGCLCNGTCLCAPGYYGPSCTFRNCSKPCENGGTCNKLGLCDCPATYGGAQCEKDLCSGSYGYYSNQQCIDRNGTDNNSYLPEGPARLSITTFQNLYVNELGLDQGTTLGIYFKTEYGAVVKGEIGKEWYTRVAQYGSVFSTLSLYNFLRIEAQGFLYSEGSITMILYDDSSYSYQEYFNVRRWILDPDTGNEIGEIPLQTIGLINPARLVMIGFSYLSPVNNTFVLKALVLDSESKIEKIQSRPSGSNIFTSTGKVTYDGLDYTWIIVGATGGGLGLTAAVVVVIYYRRRQRKVEELRRSQMAASQAASSTRVASSPGSQISLSGIPRTRSETSLSNFGADTPNSVMSRSTSQTFLNPSAAQTLLNTSSSMGNFPKSSSLTRLSGATLVGNSIQSGAVAVPGYMQMKTGKDYMVDSKVLANGATSRIFGGRLTSPMFIEQSKGVKAVAVKIINPNVEQNDSNIFYYEIAILYSVRKCDNIVQMIGYNEAPKSIIMKLYKFNLKEMLAKRSFKVDHVMARKIAHDLISGLSYIHNNGIIHLNLCPQNVLLDVREDESFTCVISDFGFATLVSDSSVKRKVVSGLQIPAAAGITIRYAAPELIEKVSLGQGRLQFTENDKKIDIYAFALTFYEVVTRTQPWDGIEDVDSIKQVVLNGMHPTINERYGEVSQIKKNNSRLLKIIEMGWSRNPIDRPSCNEISSML